MLSWTKEELFRRLSPELKLISAGIWFAGKNAWRRQKSNERLSNILNECKNQYSNESGDHKNHKVPMSPLWQKVLDSIKLKILDFKNPHQAIRFGQTKARFDHRLNIASCIYDLPLQAGHLRVEFPQFSALISDASDSDFSCPETMIKYKGKLISNILYFHLRYILQCLTNVSKPHTICEIGGGYGGSARLWFTNTFFNPKSYVIIDFPEALFFSNLFLKATLPNVNVIHLEKTITLEKLPENSIILCPFHLLDKLKPLKFDLVLNTGSLQEMTEEAVDFWMDWIDQSNSQFFYSLNYFSQPLNFLAEGYCLWSTRLSNRWIYRVNRSNPYFIKSQSTRNFGEIFAERLPSPITLDNASVLQRYNYLTSLSLDEQVFMELIDLVRITKDSKITWMVLNTVLKRMRYIPKEALYLANLLKKNKPENVSVSEIDQIHEHLLCIYKNSTRYYD